MNLVGITMAAMTLAVSKPIGFIPTQKPKEARHFYEEVLGLTFETDNDFAIVFRSGPAPGMMLRLVRTPSFTPASYTAFGWYVHHLEEAIDALAAKGVTFERYGYFKQDERGIWNAPDGTRIAWFKDPDGNTLSISQYP